MDTALQVESHQSGAVGQHPRIPNLLAAMLLMQTRIWLAFWTAARYWVMLSCLSINPPKCFSSGLLPIPSLLSLYLCLGLHQPRCNTLHLALLICMVFTREHLSSLSRFPCTASFPSSMSIAPQSLMSSANLLNRHSIPLSCHQLGTKKYCITNPRDMSTRQINNCIHKVKKGWDSLQLYWVAFKLGVLFIYYAILFEWWLVPKVLNKHLFV